jgi:hypothetical protein
MTITPFSSNCPTKKDASQFRMRLSTKMAAKKGHTGSVCPSSVHYNSYLPSGISIFAEYLSTKKIRLLL